MKVSSLKCSINRPYLGTQFSTSKTHAGLPTLTSSNSKGKYISLPSDTGQKKNKLCIQEIQLDNNKWFVFSEEAETETGGRNWGVTSLRKKAPPSKKDWKRVGDLSTKENIRLVTDFQQKRPTMVKLQSPLLKVQQKCLKNSQRSEKLRTSRKVTLVDKEQTDGRESPSPNNSRFKNYSKSNKSNRSIKSVGSNRGQNNLKGSNKQQMPMKVNIAHPKTKEIVNCIQGGLPEVNNEDRKEEQTQKRILIASIYDKIELLNPNLLKQGLCTDFYLDFPEWKLPNPPPVSPPSKNQQIIPQPLPSLSPEIDACFDSTISKSVGPSRASTLLQALQPLPEQSLSNQDCPQPLPVPSESPIEVIEVKGMNQCLFTNSTEPHQKSQYSNVEIQATPMLQQVKSPKVFQEIEQQSSRDRSFDQLNQFSQFKEVRLIQINHNQQTALLPSKFSNQFLLPIPSASSLHNQFKNDHILYFLNHIIFAQPHLIYQAFQLPNKYGFSCKLFVNGQKQNITVDGIFPYDANYYPLYGFSEQFIWFSVMIKCIAKLKGSYAAINSLIYKDIYEILTGSTLLAFDMKANEYRTLKQLKILLKTSQQSKTTLLLAKKQNHFFKILKIQPIKPVAKAKQTHKNQYSNKTSDSCEDNFKSLNLFLKQQIKICEKNQLHQNTAIYLKGFNKKRKMTFKDFINEGFEVIASDDILKPLTQAGLKLEGFSQS